MRIKRYEAPTIQEALLKVKKDLGPEAVILYTKTFRKGGVLGLFGKPVAEITAGVDLNLLDDVGRKHAAAATPAAVAAGGRSSPASPAPPPPGGTPAPDLFRPRAKALQRELNEMKTTALSSLLKDLSGESPVLLSEGFQRLKKRLLKQEVEEILVQRILQGMMEDRVDPDARVEVAAWLERFTVRHLKVAPAPSFGGFPRVLAFVGPTGVGKTTTLAKLAARFGLMERRKVVLVTADTYRIAATEQLKTYGKIMGLPVEVVESPEDMVGVLSRYKTQDLILLDTAGRSPSNTEQIEELKQFVFRSQPDETHLVMSATTKYSDMLRILERFGSAAPVNRLVFTKLDETKGLGSLLNLLVNFPIPVSFASTGQNVPDDLEVPDPQRFAARIADSLLA